MSGKRSRDKGKRGEREFANELKVIYPEAKRGWQSRCGSDAPDVDGTPWWVEVKIGARPNIMAAVAQADAATDGRPVLVASKRDRGPWLVTMHLCDWLEMQGVRYVTD